MKKIVMVALSAVVISLSSASAITIANGQIDSDVTGISVLRRVSHAEPSSWFLMAAGGFLAFTVYTTRK
ncbi:hypothetical protein L4X63_19875 [Geomonas sp. Red32]|uniref:hypothetical protein n=1 Tax=Geomonas sp. Red32 TaxID=2912856 RepID=UPI00202CD62A|nr:hypothetical protein [Geomonas sp. Red32]MCM0083849.1 hypothetical protein [Geomonas sp. Red32]